eukprot:GILI01008115.1.p1 GENE.GILI01008115.1~~GILI01008115.1.p1  ORF type:complete len:390 (-),score=53.04 GILI01008115.1:147-1316(-)
MRRSHPSSLDPKGLTGLTFDVCSIASTETASTVAGRGRGRGGLRKRRGGGPISDDDDSTSMGLYSDPFSSMFSPTSYVGGSSGLLGCRKVTQPKSTTAMAPPDPRRSHGALIGSKQGTHARTPSAHTGVQSVKVEISPTGSPNSPIPPSVTSGIKAPTINAFRRCLMVKGGGGGAHVASPLIPSPTQQTHSNSLFYFEGGQNSHGQQGHFPQVEVTFTNDTVELSLDIEEGEEVSVEGPFICLGNEDDEDGDEETHIFLFDNDPEDHMPIVSSSHGHAGGKVRSSRKALACKAAAPYAKTSAQQGTMVPPTLSSRRQRKACRSRYDIEEGDDNDDNGAAIYYVQVGHTALTPRDRPDDVMHVPQIPLLPGSVATTAIDEELAGLEELML